MGQDWGGLGDAALLNIENSSKGVRQRPVASFTPLATAEDHIVKSNEEEEEEGSLETLERLHLTRAVVASSAVTTSSAQEEQHSSDQAVSDLAQDISCCAICIILLA